MTIREEMLVLLGSAAVGDRVVFKFGPENKSRNKSIAQEMAKRGCFRIEQWHQDQDTSKNMFLIVIIKDKFDPPWILDRMGRDLLFVRNKTQQKELRTPE